MHKHLFSVVVATLVVSKTYAYDESHDPAAHHDRPAVQPAHTDADPASGRPGDAAKVQRTIRVEMRDPHEFVPAELSVATGEVVRFVVVNTGEHLHEMVLGTMKELEQHNEEMKAHPGMRHAAPYIAQVAPGRSGVIIWQFTTPGSYYYGCLLEDHFDMGMFGKVRVSGDAVTEAHDGHHAHGAAASPEHAAASDGREMTGMYGLYPMAREASGTAWQPDAAPHGGIHRMYGEWSTMTHGFVNLIYDRQGGPRGDTKTFSTSMLMTMAQRPLGAGTVGLRGMVSLDALMGERGYPLLLQTGESANGQPLIDRQHPHDLFMELAASYSHPLGERRSLFVYAGLPGEPALGPPAFMHRFSGEDNPEAPITHHWLDSTHITYGVVTLGAVFDRFKIEGSLFRGREPDENRYDIESGRLDSASVRLSFNPTANWALQVSGGRIKSPEQLHPDVDIDRTTASVIYHRPFSGGHMQTTLAWGRNAPSHGEATSTWLLESAVRFGRSHTFFGRAERADKNELFLPDDPRAEEKFRVGKLSLGYVYDLPRESRLRIGFGGLVSRYSLPADLAPVYGDPTSFMLFGRLKI